MELLIIFGGTIALFAHIGRSSVPASERLQLSSWQLPDVARNAWLGLLVCSAQTPLNHTLEEMFRDNR